MNGLRIPTRLEIMGDTYQAHQTRSHPKDQELWSPLPRRSTLEVFLLGRHSRPPSTTGFGGRCDGWARSQSLCAEWASQAWCGYGKN